MLFRVEGRELATVLVLDLSRRFKLPSRPAFFDQNLADRLLERRSTGSIRAQPSVSR